ncbi:hypothetical protein [Actinophytocola algeriensis]|uniref:Uncharacterized protein n=1 Tax=Actinophytocola algeriensis TaxID=1768010 RepID=A0A7W7PZQ7_9PSEU|nr:hypothetical protein [Actinophytocola algeriensis]MBB4904311.1 hypothetical protein [Actinophytocola algeriensis]MBE1476831.1 hypothetical protein [Actinophytocola algeriensis]
MADPIEVHYTPDGDDWTVTVKGRGQTLTGNAPGLIAARDRADQLVEKLTSDEPGHRTVVHLLGGDAVEFTTAYLTARLAKTQPDKPAEVPTPAERTAEKATERAAQQAPQQTVEKAEAPKPEKAPKPTPTPRAGSAAAQPDPKAADPQEAPANSGT